MKARRVVEEVLVPMTIVAAPPATVTQRTCLEHFGVTPRDYLRFIAEGGFPVTEKGKLRVAEYADVLRYLTDGAAARTRTRRRRHDERPPDVAKVRGPSGADRVLDELGFGRARR